MIKSSCPCNTTSLDRMLFINESMQKIIIFNHRDNIMLKILCTLASLFTSVLTLGSLTNGDGIWSLISISKCDVELDTVAVLIEIQRSRVNMTLDVISAVLDVELIIDDSYGILIEVCKFVDGGCKSYQVISDDSIVNLVDKYAKKNVVRAFELAKIDPPEFPVNEGHYEIVDFIMDYCEMPTNSVYGKFEAEVSLLNTDGDRVACLTIVIEFAEFEDEEDFCG